MSFKSRAVPLVEQTVLTEVKYFSLFDAEKSQLWHRGGEHC